MIFVFLVNSIVRLKILSIVGLFIGGLFGFMDSVSIFILFIIVCDKLSLKVKKFV